MPVNSSSLPRVHCGPFLYLFACKKKKKNVLKIISNNKYKQCIIHINMENMHNSFINVIYCIYIYMRIHDEDTRIVFVYIIYECVLCILIMYILYKHMYTFKKNMLFIY